MEQNMETIDLRDIIRILRKRWWIVLSVTLIASLISAIYSFFLTKPVYQANTTMAVIGKKVDSNTANNYSDLMADQQLVKDVREVVKSRLVSNEVLLKLKKQGSDIGGLDSDKLAQKLAVNQKNDTRVIEITADDTNPKFARDVVNLTAEVFSEKVKNILDVENVQVIDKAEVPPNPIKPNKKLNMAVAFILGLMLGGGIIFLIEYLDNTIRTPEDVQRYIGLPVIGTIPLFPE
jgi:capsular polysaccharide biosynthesis protein